MTQVVLKHSKELVQSKIGSYLNNAAEPESKAWTILNLSRKYHRLA